MLNSENKHIHIHTHILLLLLRDLFSSERAIVDAKSKRCNGSGSKDEHNKLCNSGLTPDLDEQLGICTMLILQIINLAVYVALTCVVTGHPTHKLFNNQAEN